MKPSPHIAIGGAGAIGCYIGGLLQAAGRNVTFLGRPSVLDPIHQNGLRLTDFSGRDMTLHPTRLSFDPACLHEADLILVTVKSAGTADIAQDIARHARAETPVISLQNGIANAKTLRDALPGRDIRAGMVPFNVTSGGAGHWHRGTSGAIQIAAGPGGLGQILNVDGLEVSETDQIEAVQWGKLLINLNNALNALSGLTLLEQLQNRDWRRLMARQMAEALKVFRAAGITPARFTAAPPAMVPHILRLPTPLFRRIAAQMLTIDPQARSSMQDDLRAGRRTEIDSLQGEILALAAQHAVPCPTLTRITQAIRQAEAANAGSPGLTPRDLASRHI